MIDFAYDVDKPLPVNINLFGENGQDVKLGDSSGRVGKLRAEFDTEGYDLWAETVGLSDVPNLNGSPICPYRTWIKANSKVTELTVYKQDIRVKRVLLNESDKPSPGNNGARRGKADKVSQKSLDNLRFLVMNTYALFYSIITLTYPNDFPSDGKAVKKHLNSLLTRLRQKYGKNSYVWVVEFQRRGAPHYHIIVGIDLAAMGDLVTKKRSSGKFYQTNIQAENWLAETWNRVIFENIYWQPNEDDRQKHLNAGVSWEVSRDQNGCAKYIAKYACKPQQKQIPDEYQDIGRAWGASRDVAKNVEEVAKISLENVPMGEEMVMTMLEKSEHAYMPSLDKLGYLPKTLYGFSGCILRPNKEVDDCLIELHGLNTQNYKPSHLVTPDMALALRVKEAKAMKAHHEKIAKIATNEFWDFKLRAARQYYGWVQSGDAEWVEGVENEFEKYLDCDMETTSDNFRVGG